MIRATTPTHRLELHTDVNYIDKILITYKQNGNVVLEKTEEDVDKGDEWVKVNLTQEETKLFADYMPAEVQVRIKTNEGKVIASKVIKVTVGEVLNDEVM